MATKSIPAWSANLSVNVPRDERNLLGRLAHRFGARSVGAFVKELIAAGLAAKCAVSAAELRQIRARYYAACLLAVFGMAMVGDFNGQMARTCNRVPLRCRTCQVTGRTVEENSEG